MINEIWYEIAFFGACWLLIIIGHKYKKIHIEKLTKEQIVQAINRCVKK